MPVFEAEFKLCAYNLPWCSFSCLDILGDLLCYYSTKVKVLWGKDWKFYESGYPKIHHLVLQYFCIFINYGKRKKNWKWYGWSSISAVRDFYIFPSFISTTPRSSTIPTSPTFYVCLSLYGPFKTTLPTLQQTPESFSPTLSNKLSCRTLTSEQTKISVGVIFNHKKNLKKSHFILPQKKTHHINLKSFCI